MNATATTRVSPLIRFGKPILAIFLVGTSLLWSADMLRPIGLVLLDEQIMAPMLGAAIALVFIVFPAKRNAERTCVPWYDLVAAAAGLGAGIYVGITYPSLIERLIFRPWDGFIVSLIFFITCMEGLRRAAGYSLFIVVIIFVAYALVGHLVPGDLQTRKVEAFRLISYLGMDTNALMGFILKTAATIVFTFVFFGQLLMRSGGSGFFNEVSLALMGRYRGGSAKIAITASSLFGSISGIVVSNIVATGVVTIPMMKKAGFPPRLAAAVEACASTGGQLMPPVMGAVAFLMADFLQRPYRDIVIAALVPSLLYYVALFIQADLEAARRGITRVEEHLIPKIWPVLKSGWIFIVPFAALIYTLFWLNWQVQTSAVLACLLVLLAGLFVGYKGAYMSLRDIYEALVETGTSILDILMIVSCATFIIGVLQVTGLGFALTQILVKFGGGNLFVLLLLSAVVCIVLGMGMPTLAVYVMLAALVAPSMVEVGIPKLAAHMFILYLGMMSFLTPPVAIAAFFAASLAQAPAMATGWTSMRFGWTAYVVPFLFVFSPALLLQSPHIYYTVINVATAIAGVWLMSAAMIGYFFRHMDFLMRVGVMVAGVLLLIPTGFGVKYVLIPAEFGNWVVWLNAVGAVLGGVLLFSEYSAARRGRAETAAALAAESRSTE